MKEYVLKRVLSYFLLICISIIYLFLETLPVSARVDAESADASDPDGGRLYYRCGTPLPYPNGSIIWEDERTVRSFQSEAPLSVAPVITVDSSGYPWIGLVVDGGQIIVYKASTKGGSSWNRICQIPGGVEDARVTIVPLQNCSIYIIYGFDGVPIYGRLWNGSFLEDVETVSTSDFNINTGFSAVADGDDIHLVFGVVDTCDIKYIKYTYGVGWGSEVIIQPAQDNNSCPSIALGPIGCSTKLAVFWIHNDTVYMKRYVDGTWDVTPLTPFGTKKKYFTGASERGENLVCFYQAWARRIAVLWRNGTYPGPYQVIYSSYVFSIWVDSHRWYYWNAESNKAVIVLFGGSVGSAKPPSGPVYYFVVVCDVYRHSFYDINKENFIENLYLNGYSVLTNRHTPFDFSYSGNETWLHDAATWLKNQGYYYVSLFGFSAGGVVVAYEIQKDYATCYSAAVIASAPVNTTCWYNPYGLFLSAQNASKVKVCTSFIANENDSIYDKYGVFITNTYEDMRLYHDNMVVHNEWHNWTMGESAHDPFPDTCADHPGETVSDATVDWYQHTHTLVVKVPQAPPEGVKVWVDGGEYTAYADAPVSVVVNPGEHTIEAQKIFVKSDGKTNYIFTFDHWSDDSTDNPRTIHVASDTTLTAWYKRSKQGIQSE